MHFVAFGQQELGQIGAVLAGYAGDESSCRLHVSRLRVGLFVVHDGVISVLIWAADGADLFICFLSASRVPRRGICVICGSKNVPKRAIIVS